MTASSLKIEMACGCFSQDHLPSHVLGGSLGVPLRLRSAVLKPCLHGLGRHVQGCQGTSMEQFPSRYEPFTGKKKHKGLCESSQGEEGCAVGRAVGREAGVLRVPGIVLGSRMS